MVRDGVVVASDKNSEWLLPWWWMHYSLTNTFPVTFINFGNLSSSMVKWCQERGDVEDFHPPDRFNSIVKDEKSLVWFKKPFAMLQSLYERTIWFDLDCWIKDSVAELFTKCENEAGIGIVKEPQEYQKNNVENGLIQPGEVMYNAGVIVYKKGSPIMQLWTEELLKNPGKYYADQDALSRLICQVKIPFTRIDPIYNWIPIKVEHPDAKVLHMVQEGFKKFIKVQIHFLKHHLMVHFP